MCKQMIAITDIRASSDDVMSNQFSSKFNYQPVVSGFPYCAISVITDFYTRQRAEHTA